MSRLNLANKLTLIRIFLIPVFVLVIFTQIPYGDVIAALIFIIAAATDGLDGYFARTRKEITVLGKFMDPLADKLLISAALIALVDMGRLSSWIAIIIVSREFAVTGLRTIAAAEGVVISASKLGKLKTITQIVGISCLLFDGSSFIAYIMPPEIFHIIALAIIYVALFFTIYSGVDYLVKCWPFLFPSDGAAAGSKAKMDDLETGDEYEGNPGNKIITIDEIAKNLVEKLRKKNLRLAIAESCTGGLLASAVTAVAGSSNCFAYGVVSYSDEVKEKILNVPSAVLREYTAVSKETAIAMAQGLSSLSGADIALSVTGYAGPEGGDENNPVGTVYFGLTYLGQSQSYRYVFEGGRDEVRKKALKQGLTKVLEMI